MDGAAGRSQLLPAASEGAKDDELVLLDIDESLGVATLTLNRPKSGNAINAAMAARLIRLLRHLNTDHDEVRVIVLTGAGRFFCTGMDLRGGAGAGGVSGGGGGGQPYAPFEAVWSSAKPVVGVLNGPALGGGVGFFFACDVRVAAAESHVAFPEAAVGLYPALISAYIAPQLGPYLTQSLMMTGEAFTAQQLFAAGQITRVAPSGEPLRAAVKEVLKMLLAAPRHAHAGVKRIVRLVSYCGAYHDEALDALLNEFQAMLRSDEARHGIKTFSLTKEKPDWGAWYASKRAERKRAVATAPSARNSKAKL